MPLSTDVRLPKDVIPIFPRRCVYSGEENPDMEVSVIANSLGALTSLFLPFLYMFCWRRVRVPILRRYRARFYLQRYGRGLATLILVVLALVVFAPMVDRTSPYRKWKMLGLIMAAFSPWIAFETFWPQRVEVTTRRGWIDYEFADADYAEEFAELNAPHVMQIL